MDIFLAAGTIFMILIGLLFWYFVTQIILPKIYGKECYPFFHKNFREKGYTTMQEMEEARSAIICGVVGVIFVIIIIGIFFFGKPFSILEVILHEYNIYHGKIPLR